MKSSNLRDGEDMPDADTEEDVRFETARRFVIRLGLS